MLKIRTIAQAALLALGAVAAPVLSIACTADSARPFNSGPYDAAGTQKGVFSEYVVDNNGIALQVCTDGDGAVPCFFDLPVAGNALSESLGRGNEAFFFLANSTGTSTGAFPIDWTIVMGVESAFLAAEPTLGFQTQFQRLRTRVNVSAVGIYTVETPWRTAVYRVESLLPPGNGQNRSEISEPIDISFGPDATVAGLVSPFLVSSSYQLGDVYIGDGLTPTKVTGSPCGTNYVKITAVGLDGVTPIPIAAANSLYGPYVVREDNFTVMGKIAPKAKVPLSVGAAYYSRNGGTTKVSVMAEGSTSATQLAEMKVTINGTALPLDKAFNRFYGTVTVEGALPASVTVTASDTGRPSLPNSQEATLKDLVTISQAEARCQNVGTTESPVKSCTLIVQASSSDDGSGVESPVLTVQHANAVLVGGAASIVKPAVPASVTVTSSKGGVAVKPVTIINQ